MGAPSFGATTSKNRFKFLFACVSFDDFDTREQKWKHDRFAAMRDLFKLFNKNGSTGMVPKKYFLCISETLYPSRNKIVCRQYNPSKPAKYGLLFKSINAVTYTYTYNMIPYYGKPNEKPTAHYVKRMEETVKHLVQNLQS